MLIELSLQFGNLFLLYLQKVAKIKEIKSTIGTPQLAH
jgi:hypothetical protein